MSSGRLNKTHSKGTKSNFGNCLINEEFSKDPEFKYINTEDSKSDLQEIGNEEREQKRKIKEMKNKIKMEIKLLDHESRVQNNQNKSNQVFLHSFRTPSSFIHLYNLINNGWVISNNNS